jgi:valyl-tRNA synthetase
VQVKGQQVEGKEFARKSKISKSKDGDKYSPLAILDTFGSDPVRYWTSSGTLGTDIAFDEAEIKNVNKLLTKLWNSSRFCATFLVGFDTAGAAPELQPVDRWALERFNRVIETYHKAFDRYEFYPARVELERFFWGTFCDNYLELVKYRLWDAEGGDGASARAAQWTLYHLLLGQLKLFAPYICHITEEIYQALFRETEAEPSIHIAAFPAVDAAFDDADGKVAGDRLVDLITLIRTYKSKHAYSMKLPVETLTISCDAESQAALERVVSDLCAVAHIASVEFSDTLEDPFEDRTDALQIQVVMDADAVRRTEILATIKPVINALKKELGLKAKEPIAKVYVQAEGELLALLEKEPGQIAAGGRAEAAVFNADGIEYSDTPEDGVRVAVEQ